MTKKTTTTKTKDELTNPFRALPSRYDDILVILDSYAMLTVEPGYRI